jgi:excisionase family DNA binding protein
MHKIKTSKKILHSVLTAQEAAQLWRLSRNAISDACRRGALPARKSGQTWLITFEDMLIYQDGRYWPDLIPEEFQPALKASLAKHFRPL